MNRPCRSSVQTKRSVRSKSSLAGRVRCAISSIQDPVIGRIPHFREGVTVRIPHPGVAALSAVPDIESSYRISGDSSAAPPRKEGHEPIDDEPGRHAAPETVGLRSPSVWSSSARASSRCSWRTRALRGRSTNMSWTVSNNQVAATNVSYAYSFKTATAGTIKTITFAVSGAGLGRDADDQRCLRDRRRHRRAGRPDDHLHRHERRSRSRPASRSTSSSVL